MSIGPTPKDEFKIKKIEQVKNLFRNPLKGIFYVSLAGLIFGEMAFDKRFSWEIYFIIFMLAVANYYSNKNK